MKKRQRKKNEKRYKQTFIEEMKLRYGDPPYEGIAAMAKKLQLSKEGRTERSGTDYRRNDTYLE